MKGKGVLGARETRGPERVLYVSLAPKTPFPFPSKRLPRRQGLVSLIESSGSETESPRIADLRLVSSRRKETSGIDLNTVG